MRSTITTHHRRTALLSVAALAALTACGAGADEATTSSGEAAGARVAVSYEGGVAVLDGESLEVVGDLDSESFTRLNPVGDGRHVMVTTSQGFEVLDAGTDGSGPAFTGQVFDADTPGHVVGHAGTTVLYADGTSETTIFETEAIGAAGDRLPETRTVAGAEGVQAHHGVSLVLENGDLLTTVGDGDTRTGAEVRDPGGDVVASSADCPGVHGEGTAADEVVVLGCEDGALLYADGKFTKLDAPDQPYGRTGNAYVSQTSPLVVGDYRTDPDLEGYLLDAVTVIDTEEDTLDVVELPEGAQYTFRGVARGPDDLAYVLASDGAIHVLDPATRELVETFPVVAPWEGPAEWQDPHPSIKVEGDLAYVTEPATREVHAVDLTTGEVAASVVLDAEPNEIVVAAG